MSASPESNGEGTDPSADTGNADGRNTGDGAPTHRPGMSLGVDPKLLALLVCPVTRGPLDYDAVRQELVSASAKLAYPIRDGIPIMLADEARKLTD